MSSTGENQVMKWAGLATNYVGIPTATAREIHVLIRYYSVWKSLQESVQNCFGTIEQIYMQPYSQCSGKQRNLLELIEPQRGSRA